MPLPAPVAAPQPALDHQALLLEVVAEKTGYPAAMLTMDMELEAGLGIDSIKRVYELQERWTQAIGGFNMKIGGMTSGLRGAQKAATAWSSTINSLRGVVSMRSKTGAAFCGAGARSTGM